jgi:hypothetical protein
MRRRTHPQKSVPEWDAPAVAGIENISDFGFVLPKSVKYTQKM